MRQSSIICFGEVLWDLLPTGKIAGGAPMNVAFHANNLGVRAHMISRIGADELGAELLEFLRRKGVATDFVQTDELFPTGIVNVTLDRHGSPSYEIVQPVAWDYIQPDDAMCKAVGEADALVYGSLACRTERTKTTVLELLEAARLRVFDVNLRTPFYSQRLLDELLQRADVVKMNDEELGIIAGWLGVEHDEGAQMQRLLEKYHLTRLIVTKGRHGAVCLDATGRYAQEGFAVSVQDTIGSGDAFLAAFLSRMLAGEAPARCLEFACAMGALVAAETGGTPVVLPDTVNAFVEARRGAGLMAP
jgi:fructokinase